MTKSFLRAFLIVTMTAMNVKLIARGMWVPMFISGGLLSWIWWENTRMANNGGRRQQIGYAVGAACGTITGAWIGGMI
jgi:hypothetical protein